MPITSFNSYNKKLFIYFFLVFSISSSIIFIVQYQREKKFRVDNLEVVLNTYNEQIYNYIISQNYDITKIDSLLLILPDKELRVTIIKKDGVVTYDSFYRKVEEMENHINRPEVKAASLETPGNSIRLSATTNIEYYYYAREYPEFYLRTAQPYTIELVKMLHADQYFISFIIVVFILISITLVYLSDKVGRSIKQLSEFAQKAVNNEPIDTQMTFPKNELGDIGQQIVQIYKNLRSTKVELTNEKEKLFKHLQISQEGLAVFNSDRKSILSNGYFLHFANVICDQQITWAEEIFADPEFDQINQFINKVLTDDSITYQSNGSALPSHPKVIKEKFSINKNGSYFKILCIVFVDKNFEITINDVTRQEKEDTLKRQLTQNIAHELKTPVSSLQGYIETILRNKNLPKEKTQFFLERSLTQAQRLSALIADISLLTKIDSASDLFHTTKITLNEIINNVGHDVQLLLKEKNIRFTNKINQPLELTGNQSLIYSIFRNLTDNSIHYAGENTDIKISCLHNENDEYLISYCDTGIGIPQEHLQRIFDRFYRVDFGRSRKVGGTGLGLAIVKNAVLFHNGKISVKNRPSGGVEFLFTLSKYMIKN